MSSLFKAVNGLLITIIVQGLLKAIFSYSNEFFFFLIVFDLVVFALVARFGTLKDQLDRIQEVVEG